MPWSRRRLIVAGLAALASRAQAAEESPPQVRILFLGNSYMATNGLPAMVGELLQSSKLLAPHIASYLLGSYKLEQHATDPNVLKLLKDGADDGKPWDVLVVQEQSIISSLAGIDRDAQQYMSGGLSKLVALAREVNPKVLVVDFQVWARHESLWAKNSPEALSTGASPDVAHARIRQANANAVKAALEKNAGANILVSPVGDFWRLVHDMYPALPLYAEDGTHPDMLGTLLSALVLAGSIGGRDVIELSNWVPPDCPVIQFERVKKMLLDHPEVFKNAGK
ncbi:hypothetical protein [Prosthecobacter sp.]|uniref:hypothetical protein n=1 Tax=Prosthecobacter sp. TaxID=1965333 RepID=UPI001DD34EB2|nr:hypothetical protein [Prosthecobacter sp.]MCB1275395.1 hypothetical protein [Prosthecobacter sp.]